MTTDVVPSPTSRSWRSASSTSVRAAGCSTSSSFKMVAPSLVTVTSPISSTYPHQHKLKCVEMERMPAQKARHTSILSKPTGPSVLFTMFAIAMQAVTFWLRISWPVVFLKTRGQSGHQAREAGDTKTRSERNKPRKPGRGAFETTRAQAQPEPQKGDPITNINTNSTKTRAAAACVS